MLILDTNVVSELMRPEPDARVIAWMAAYPATSLFLTTVTEAELRYGMTVLPPGRRRSRLTESLESMLRDDFAQRILSFDRDAARDYAGIVAHRRQIGRPIAQFDAQIAAIACARNAGVATRNQADFSNCGIEAINPWDAPD